MRVRWTAWLRPRYVWMRVRRLFGWRPEWERRILNQKLRPQVMMMDQRLYDDLLRCEKVGPTCFHVPPDKFEKSNGELLKYDFEPDWGPKDDD